MSQLLISIYILGIIMGALKYFYYAYLNIDKDDILRKTLMSTIVFVAGIIFNLFCPNLFWPIEAIYFIIKQIL